MPYIKQADRKDLDVHINALAEEIARLSKNNDTDFAGLLNYSCTRLALTVVQLRFGQFRYWIIATITGVFKNAADEMYRRIGVAYEDKQIEKNGDVDMYAEFLEEINK
ncbi:MAG: hypothetical protein Q8O83_04000 [bacterium]|nr:hypothetical protein [bacterium]